MSLRGLWQGLGKTLQATCIIASTHAEQRAAFQAGTGPKPLPSLVVCPPTLVAHWADEVEKYLVNKDEVRRAPLPLDVTRRSRACVVFVFRRQADTQGGTLHRHA